ncbi:MAG: ABC transporter substrate-binding protein, partial [Candidatus Rokuibacteriota bacterium]
RRWPVVGSGHRPNSPKSTSAASPGGGSATRTVTVGAPKPQWAWDYWGGGPYLDQLEVIDLGDDPAAAISAMASRQVDGLYQADIGQLDALQKLAHVQLYQTTTAQTAVARVHPVKPFDDKRVRQAMRYAIDQNAILQLAHRGLGSPGEHHHVSPIHPEYAKLPPFQRDVAKAKKLLADAGYPNGIDTEIVCRPQPAWELAAVQGMVEQWKDAGIRVKISVIPSIQFWEVWTKVPFGFTGWAHRPLGVMVLGLAYRTGVPWNESKYSNRDFDSLLTQAEGMLHVNRAGDHGQARGHSPGRRADRAAALALDLHLHGQARPGLQGAPDALHLRPPARDEHVEGNSDCRPARALWLCRGRARPGAAPRRPRREGRPSPRRWRGDLFVGALRERALVRLRFDGERVVSGSSGACSPDGHLYVLTDESNGVLARLEPATP